MASKTKYKDRTSRWASRWSCMNSTFACAGVDYDWCVGVTAMVVSFLVVDTAKLLYHTLWLGPVRYYYV